MTVTMHDVAEAAGVSITTVSHVMNDTRAIAPATRRRVLKAIEDLSYYKNSSARLLVRGYSDALGLIISDIENPFFPQLIKGFERACHAEHLELILGMTNYERKNADAAVRRMIEDKVRGVAIMSAEFDLKLVERLLDRNIPVVRLDDLQLRRNQSSVRIDYSTGVAQAVDHLARLGHRDVAIIHGPLKVLSARRYRKLLINSVREHDMRITCCIEAENRPVGGAEAVKDLRARKIYPTAILCGNDLLAIGAMGQALRSGWCIPQDVSIIGSDDIAFALYGHPPLSTVRVEKDEVGISAFRLLQQMFKDKNNHGIAVKLATQFIPRESSGPARGRNAVKETAAVGSSAQMRTPKVKRNASYSSTNSTLE
jgi:LacI family transcriptional regulator